MRLALPGLLQNGGGFLTPSVVDRLGVGLLGLLLRLLAAPTQAMPADLADVLDVGLDAEVAADHLGDPPSTPKGIEPAVLGGPLGQKRFQLGELLGGEPNSGTRVRLGSQPLGSGLGHLLPAVQ